MTKLCHYRRPSIVIIDDGVHPIDAPLQANIRTKRKSVERSKVNCSADFLLSYGWYSSSYIVQAMANATILQVIVDTTILRTMDNHQCLVFIEGFVPGTILHWQLIEREVSVSLTTLTIVGMYSALAIITIQDK